MFEALAPVITAVKDAGPKIYSAVLICTGLLLGLPDSAIAQLGLTEIRDSYRMQLGLGFLASLSLLIVHTVHYVFSYLRFNYRFNLILSELTHAEKSILRQYIQGGETTVHGDLEDGVFNGLAAKRILFRSAELIFGGPAGYRIPYNMQPWARARLTKHPEWLS